MHCYLKVLMNYRLLSIVGLLFLSGCSYHKRYQLKRLATLNRLTATYTQTKENVTVMAKKFTSADVKEFFYGVDLIKKDHIQPVQLRLENNRTSLLTYVISKTDDALMDSTDVAYALHSSYLSAFLAGGFGGFFLAPFAGIVGGGLILGGLMGQSDTLVYTGVAVTGVLLSSPLIASIKRCNEINALVDAQLDLCNFLRKKQLFSSEWHNGLVYYKAYGVNTLMLRVYENTQLITTFTINL